jgi:uncharacterized LabA/DUF88 family protein
VLSHEVNIYIDGNNFHKSALSLEFKVDYKKFYGWLRQKYKAKEVYLFMGYVPSRQNFYNGLKEIGYNIVFKNAVYKKGLIKGNCDTELVIKVCQDLYEKKFEDFIILSNDGDFSALINFLLHKNKSVKILSPNLKKCSMLIRKTGAKLVDIKPHYHKFSLKK